MYITISPYNPQSNGLAENAVRTIKHKLKTEIGQCQKSDRDIFDLLNRILFMYRITPHTSTGISPSEKLFSRKLRCRFNIATDQTHIPDKHDANVHGRTFKIGDSVMIRNYRIPNKKGWTPAIVENKVGTSTYFCKTVDGSTWKRHTNQMIHRNAKHSVEADRENQQTNVPPFASITYPYYPNDINVHTRHNVEGNSSAISESANNADSLIVDNNSVVGAKSDVPVNKEYTNSELLDIIGLPTDYFSHTRRNISRPKRTIRRPVRYQNM